MLRPTFLKAATAGAAALALLVHPSAAFAMASEPGSALPASSGTRTQPISTAMSGDPALESTRFGVTDQPPPTMSDFEPQIGDVGLPVWIYGTNFTGATSVTFAGAPAEFTAWDTQILAIVPPDATTGLVSVTTPGGTATSFYLGWFHLIPTIASFTPASGPPGTLITITGTGLASPRSVTMGGRGGEYQVVSPTQIIFHVSCMATSGPITVSNEWMGDAATTSTSFDVTIPPAPAISSFSPTSGSLGRTVTITGTDFRCVRHGVSFDGMPATYQVDSDAQITTWVPCAATGPITVTGLFGSGTSSSSFNVTMPAPTISSFTPTSGPVGTSVTITGTDLLCATTVAFEATAATTYRVKRTSAVMVVTVPPAATTGPISVTTPWGTTTSAMSFTVT